MRTLRGQMGIVTAILLGQNKKRFLGLLKPSSRRKIMGLFKSGKENVDDLLTVLIPALSSEIEEEIRRRILKEMDNVVKTAAQQVMSYGYDQAIKQLSVRVSMPEREWVGLTDVDIHVLKMNYEKVKVVHTDRAEDLTVIGQDVNVNGLINAIETKLKEKNERN
jgi:Mg/Co/Ni transporter MgtE